MSSHIHIKNYGDASGVWLESTLKVIGAEVGQEHLGSNLIAQKMCEIFAQTLRSHLETKGYTTPVLSEFADPNIVRTLKAIHKTPADSWTLERLAEIAGMSRTSFTNRFSRCIAMTPLEYITHWRMQIARQQLAGSSDPIIEIAEKVGYRSEAAFSRVFKKLHSNAPATYRRIA